MATLDRKAASIVVTGEESRFRHRKRTFWGRLCRSAVFAIDRLAFPIQQGEARMICICRIANTRRIAYQNGMVCFFENRIKHRMNEPRYSHFIPDQQAGSEKTQENNQDLQCHTTFSPRAASFRVLG